MDVSRDKAGAQRPKLVTPSQQAGDSGSLNSVWRPLKGKCETGPSGNAALLLPVLIAFRLFNAVLIQTTFVPDEVWQSVEVAHRWVFGYGALTWEWNPQVAIRSPLYPLLFAVIYKTMALFGLDSRDAIVLLPRLLHGLLAGLVDYVIYVMALRLDGRSAKWVLLAELTSWFTAYCAPRSLSNSLEWALNAVAFRYYPWPAILGMSSPHATIVPFLLPVCLCVLLRPTAAILWGPVCLHVFVLLWVERSSREFRRTLLLTSLICLSCAAISLGIDRYAFGRWTVNQLNFLRFNFLSNGADFYGVQPWHWYLTSGLPSTLILHLPLALIGWLFDIVAPRCRPKKSPHSSRHPTPKKEKTVAVYFGAWVAWTTFVYSCIAHKEFRFLFPLFPLFMYHAGRGLYHLNRIRRKSPRSHSSCSPLRLLLFLVITVNLAVGGYTCLLHQRGPDALMSTLARQAAAADWSNMRPQPRLLFLMPCHSTPHLSYLHVNVSLRLLSCDPDLSAWHKADAGSYVDEADAFYEAPTRWLDANYPSGSALPQYIATFSELIANAAYGSGVLQWFRDRNYSICGEIFHSHAVSHRRHGKHILAWCAAGWKLDLASERSSSGLRYSFL